MPHADPDDPRRCTGHSSQTGKPCTNFAMHGQSVCHAHGGQAPQNKRAGQRRLEEQAAERAVIAYGLPREIDPRLALLDELYRTAGHVAWLRDRVAVLDDNELYGPVGGGGESYPRAEPHVWVRLYLEERKHLAKVAFDCIKAGIEERRVKLAEALGEEIAAFGRGLLGEFGIDPNSKEARNAFRKLLGGGSAD